ncbi:hypothetical protein pb186bvf_002299 [Paramecium bursaria]
MLTQDPLLLPYERVEKMQLKLTNDIQFLLGVEIDFLSPKIRQAMVIFNFTEDDFQRKHFEDFKIPDEDIDITYQRFYLHLHQLAKKKKILVKERNRIKKEQENQEKTLITYASSQNTFQVYGVENPVEVLDKKIQKKLMETDRTQSRMMNKFKETLEGELKFIYNNEQLQKDMEQKSLKRLQSIRTISERAHYHNKKSIDTHEQQAKLEKDRINKALRKKQELINYSAHKNQLFEKIKLQQKQQHQQKEKDMELKQQLAELRVVKHKQQEELRSIQLLSKIEEKLNKSTILKQSQMKQSRQSLHVNSRILDNNESEQEFSKRIEEIITKQLKYNQNRIQQPLKSRQQSKSPSHKNSLAELSDSIQHRSISIKPLSKVKSIHKPLNLEKVKEQEKERKQRLLVKQRSESQLANQIKEKRQLLRSSNNNSMIELQKKEQIFHKELNKIKGSLSKKQLLNHIEKWHIPKDEIIQKYLI